MTEFRYRGDVDGLRAVAVVAVLLFHSGLTCTGGFVGVDVFFVISGFLITGLILSQQASGSFSLREFWVRRIKRIAPAAATLVLATLAAGYFLLLPSDYAELGESALAQQLFVGNVYFWRNTGYFDGAAEIKPLLHTWSLAVEEQFYFFYPVLLVLLRSFSRRWKALVLLALTVGSFAICMVGMELNPNATFFLLPTRAWELSMGGLLCFLPEPKSGRSLMRQTASILGLLLILISVFTFDGATVFPGMNALVPTIGTLLLIYGNASRQSTLVGRLLSTKPMVATGLISYSLYLWHWPIMALYRYWNGSELSILDAAVCLALTVLLATASYYLVEKPLRHVKIDSRSHRCVFASILATAPVLIVLSGVIRQAGGFPGRVSEQVQAFDFSKHSTRFTEETLASDVRSGRAPTFGASEGPLELVIWGDSHAMALVAGAAEACHDLGIRGVRMTRSMTPPVLDIDVDSKENFAATTSEFNAEVMAYLNETQPRLVVLAGHWKMYAGQAGLEDAFANTIQQLRELGIAYCVVKDVAAGERSFPRLLAQVTWQGRQVDEVGVDAIRYANDNAAFHQLLAKQFPGGGPVLDPAVYLSSDAGFWPAQRGGVSMYRDADHLSVEGSLRLAPMFRDALEGKSATTVYSNLPDEQ